MDKTSNISKSHQFLIENPLVSTVNHGVWLEIEDNSYPVLEISTHGLLFQNNPLSREDWYFASITIPSIRHRLSAIIEIIHVDKKRKTLCRFKGLLSQDKMLIHDYVENLKTAQAG